MTKPKVMTLFGTRPDAIKMAPLQKVLASTPNIESLCVVTAQHREMLDQVLNLFALAPDYDLDLMEPGQTLPSLTAKALTALDTLLGQVRPNLILVHGDTSTAFVGALSAFYQKIPVGHVEAGLRTYDRYAPFPEEMNRRLVTPLADLHFCPTVSNRANLLAEGVQKGVFITGNTVIDALATTVQADYVFKTRLLQDLFASGRRVILGTIHRRENWGEPLVKILGALGDILSTFPDVTMVLPLHLNPIVRDVISACFEGHPQVILIPPLPVDEMHNLMARCHLLLTDSGGLQEEAPALGKPVLVLRRVTERPEAVTAGTVKLVGVDRPVIVRETARLLTDTTAYQAMAQAANPYGDGKACLRIRDNILYHFSLRDKPSENFSPV